MGDSKHLDDDCPLTYGEQTRNVWVVGINTALSYLAAPVLYVDALHTSLMNRLQKEAGVEPLNWLSNLPSSCYMVMSVMPLFVAWAFPQIRLLRTILVLSYGTLALGSAAVLAALMLPLPWQVQAAVVILHGAVVGGARMVGGALEFEVLGVAVASSRRGQALGLAYGLGPILAIAGNLLTQLLLAGNVWKLEMYPLPFPDNFAAVFGVSLPVLLLATFLSSRLIIPVPEHDVNRQPFLVGVFEGIGHFLGRSVVVLAVVSAILIFNGYQVLGNMTLFCGFIRGEDPSETAGYQKAILYTFKACMGVAMGWLLTRASPRSAVLCSAACGFSSVLVAILAPTAMLVVGPIHLQGIFLSFGLMGMGQLHGVYIVNYILSCAPKHLMRRYMAFTMVTMLLAAPAGVIYGVIADYFGSGGATKEFGYRVSLATAAACIALGILLSLLLPPRPRAEESTT